jgi:hypothetical protein
MTIQLNLAGIKKIERMLRKGINLPVPAVLVTCCLIDWQAKSYTGKTRYDRFGKYIKQKMPKTSQQLQENDKARQKQIVGMDCSVHYSQHSQHKPHCHDSAEILYRHVRCGLVHDFFETESCLILNRPLKKNQGVIVYTGREYSQYALVLCAQPFVREFLVTL